MKKITLPLAVVAALGLSISGAANAANNGKLNFSGTLTTVSCDITAGSGASAGSNPGDINVDMGNVSFSDIGTYAAAKLETASPIQLLVNCESGASQYDTVKMRFIAVQGSGLDNSDQRLLRTTGAATGVGIGLLDSSNNLMAMNGTETINTALVSDGADGAKAEINFGAVYVLNTTPTTPGNADAFLPFVLDYE